MTSMWNLNTTVSPVIIGSLEMIKENAFRKSLEAHHCLRYKRLYTTPILREKLTHMSNNFQRTYLKNYKIFDKGSY